MSRNGNSPNYAGMRLRRIFCPYGMRKINGYGDNVWEFYNRQYDVIGLPFQFERKPSLRQLKSVCDPQAGCSENEIHFHIDGTYGTEDYWKRISKVMDWKVKDGALELANDENHVPHSYGKLQKE